MAVMVRESLPIRLMTVWARRLLVPALVTVLIQACGDDAPESKTAASAGNAGAIHSAGAGGSAGEQSAAGPSGNVEDAGSGGFGAVAGSDDSAGAAGEANAAGASGAAGAIEPARDPAELIESGQASVNQTARPSYGALVVASDGERSYAVESRRDVEPGPFSLPWRSRFRLAAYDHGQLAWAFTADADDLIGDVVVHPSGELTLSLERRVPERKAFELVRLSRDGQPISTTFLLLRSPFPRLTTA